MQMADDRLECGPTVTAVINNTNILIGKEYLRILKYLSRKTHYTGAAVFFAPLLFHLVGYMESCRRSPSRCRITKLQATLQKPGKGDL